MHRLHQTASNNECAKQTQRKGNDAEHYHSPEHTGALFKQDQSMQQGAYGKPGDKGGVFHRVPEPPTTPTEFGIGPPGTESIACSQKDPGHDADALERGNGLGRHALLPQHRHDHSKNHCQTGVRSKDHRRMQNHADVLQNRIEVSSFGGNGREVTQERIGNRQHEGAEHANHGKHRALNARVQGFVFTLSKRN